MNGRLLLVLMSMSSNINQHSRYHDICTISGCLPSICESCIITWGLSLSFWRSVVDVPDKPWHSESALLLPNFQLSVNPAKAKARELSQNFPNYFSTLQWHQGPHKNKWNIANDNKNYDSGEKDRQKKCLLFYYLFYLPEPMFISKLILCAIFNQLFTPICLHDATRECN